jgi:hypothetical protein
MLVDAVSGALCGAFVGECAVVTEPISAIRMVVQHYESVLLGCRSAADAGTPDVHEAMDRFLSGRGQNPHLSGAVPCECMVILAATNVSREAQKVNEALRALRQEGRIAFLNG